MRNKWSDLGGRRPKENSVGSRVEKEGGYVWVLGANVHALGSVARGDVDQAGDGIVEMGEGGFVLGAGLLA